jgi:hypothetical protein
MELFTIHNSNELTILFVIQSLLKFNLSFGTTVLYTMHIIIAISVNYRFINIIGISASL